MQSLGYGMEDAMDNMIDEWADLTLIQVWNRGGMTQEGVEIADITDDVIAEIKAMEHVRAATPFYYGLSIGWEAVIYTDTIAVSSGAFIGVYMDELEDFGYSLLEGRFKEPGDPKGTILVGQQFGAWAYDFVYDEYIWPQEYDEFWNPIDKAIDPMTTELRIIPMTMDTVTWQLDYSVIGSQTAPNADHDRELNIIGIVEGNQRDWYTMQGVFVDMEFLTEVIKAFNELNPDQERFEFDGVYPEISVRVDDMNNVKAVEEELQRLGYQTYSQQEARDRMREQVQLIQNLLAALAAVSLFVAALNITNTMITAVIERTREIGVMKVLGCDVSKIMSLFLGEAMLIGFIGGIFGIGLSYIISFIINTFMSGELMQVMGGEGISIPEGVNISQIPFVLPLMGMAIAMGVSVVAGFYPAFRGTRISALSAIAHE